MGILLEGGSTVLNGGTTKVFQNIVEDGLVLFFDPNDNRSYTGTGTTVTNMAPAETNNNINGTLDDSAMYVNPSDGAAYFRVRSDSVIQRLDFSGTITRDADDGSSTVMFYFWSNYDPEGQYGNSQAFFGGKYTNYMALQYTSSKDLGFYQVEAETNGGDDGNHDYMARTNEVPRFATGSWSSWTNVITDATASNYYNGSLSPSTYPMANNAVHSFNRLGSTSTGTHGDARGGDIRMGALLIYNRALTQDEVRQNLDVLDRRFR